MLKPCNMFIPIWMHLITDFLFPLSCLHVHSKTRFSKLAESDIDLELAIDPLPRRSFVHYHFLILHYIKNKMTQISPLYVGMLTCNVNVNYTTQNDIFRLS